MRQSAVSLSLPPPCATGLGLRVLTQGGGEPRPVSPTLHLTRGSRGTSLPALVPLPPPASSLGEGGPHYPCPSQAAREVLGSRRPWAPITTSRQLGSLCLPPPSSLLAELCTEASSGWATEDRERVPPAAQPTTRPALPRTPLSSRALRRTQPSPAGSTSGHLDPRIAPTLLPPPATPRKLVREDTDPLPGTRVAGRGERCRSGGLPADKGRWKGRGRMGQSAEVKVRLSLLGSPAAALSGHTSATAPSRADPFPAEQSGPGQPSPRRRSLNPGAEPAPPQLFLFLVSICVCPAPKVVLLPL